MKGNYKAAMDSLHIPVDFQASTVRAMLNARPRRRRRAVRLAPLAACLCVLLALLPTLFGGGGYGAGGAGSMAADGNALLYWGLGSIRRFDPASGQTATLAKGAGAMFCVRRDTLYYTAGTTLYAADPATGGGRALYTVTLPYPVRAIQLCGVHDDTATLEAYPKRDGDGIRLVDVRLTGGMALGDRPYEYETGGGSARLPGHVRRILCPRSYGGRRGRLGRPGRRRLHPAGGNCDRGMGAVRQLHARACIPRKRPWKCRGRAAICFIARRRRPRDGRARRPLLCHGRAGNLPVPG